MRRYRYVFLVLGGCLLLSWALVIAVDFLNVAGLRDRLTTIFWMSLFANGRPIEWVQWYTLGAMAYLSAYVGGRLISVNSDHVQGLAKFWLIMAVAFVLMLVEDAGDVRHTILRIVEQQIGSAAGRGILSKSIEFSYFAAISMVPLYALLTYGKHVRPYATPFRYIICGFVLYGTAAISSATRHWWGGWYAHLGSAIEANTGLVFPEADPPERFPQWFVDALLEESIELLGAMFFLAAIVYIAQRLHTITLPNRTEANMKGVGNNPTHAPHPERTE